MEVRTSQVVSLVGAGLLTGNELCTWAFVHPAAGRLGREAELTFEQTITRRMLVPMGVLMTGTVAAVGWAARQASPAQGGGFRVGRRCYAVMVAVTVVGNMPLNVATLRAHYDIDPTRWDATRRWWNRFHLLRNALNVAGLLAVATSARRPDGKGAD